MKLMAGNRTQQIRQIAMLAVLLVVAGGLVYTRLSPPTTEVTTQASNTPAATPRATSPAGALPEALKLASLEPVPEASMGLRDPFGFGVPPRPPAPPPPPPPPRPAPVYVPEPPPKPVGPPPRPQIPVKFLGFAEEPGKLGKVVSLSVGGLVVLTREGDVVDGRYRLLRVGLESIVMTYLDGQGQQTIRQSGG